MTFKLHPLHTCERHADVVRERGILGYHEWLAEQRGTGRSTGRMLGQISEAILSPGKKIDLRDHEHPAVNTQGAQRVYAEQVATYCNLLRLKGMNVHRLNGQYYLVFGELK